MEKESSSIFVVMTVTILAFILTVASVIPVFGPSFVAYCLGRNKYRNESYGLKKSI